MKNRATAACTLRALVPILSAVALTLTLAPKASAQPAGYALDFMGLSNYVSVSLAAPLASNYTLTAWVYLRTGGDYATTRVAVLGGAACNDSIELLIRSQTPNAFDPQYLELGRCGAFNGTNSTIAIPSNTWTHVAATVSPAKVISYYINGVAAGSWTNLSLNFSLSSTVRLGGNNGSRIFDGQLDNVQIWNRVLSPSEIQTNLYQTLTGSESGLFAWYPFSENSGATTANAANAAGGSTGTLVNNPVHMSVVTNLSYWRLGENDPGAVNGGTATSTGDPAGSRTLTLAGGPIYDSGVSASAASTVGSTLGLSFSGSNPGTTTLIPGLTNNFGLELWVKPTSTTGNQCLAYNGDTNNSGWGLYLVGNQYRALIGGIGYVGTAPATLGTWAHLALVRNNGIATLYVNGVAAGSTNSAPNSPAGIFAVAAQPQNLALDGSFGSLDEVRVFNFATGGFNTNDLLYVNDPPTASKLSAAEFYTEEIATNLTDIVVTDVDSATVTVTLTLSTPSAGSLNTGTSGAVTSTYLAGTGVWTASGAIANVNTLLANLTFTPALNFSSNFTIATSVSDGIAAVTGNKAITGIPINDAPTASNLSAAEAYTEDIALNLVDIVVSDVDNATVTATLTLSSPSAGSLNTGTSGAVTSTYVAGTGVWTASGAIANVNILLAGLTFTPALNFNSSFAIATSVSDGIAAAITGNKAITGTAVNDAPTASNLSAGEVYTEDIALNLINIVTSDVDSSTVTATLTLSNPSAGSLNTGTSGAVTSTYVAGTGVWTASGAIANVNTLLAGLTFTPALNFNSNFTIATSVTDGIAAAITGSKTFTGTAVNDAPSATNLSAGEAYTEDTFLNLVDIVASDIDSASVTATLTLSTPGAGSLNTGTSGAVTSTYVAGTGVWTASGAIANVNTLLAGLTFTPTTNFNNNFTIATSVSDSLAAAITGSKTLTGTAVNDAPTASNLSTAESYTEDTALNLVDIVVSDVDNATVTATLTLSTPSAGSLNTGTSGAVTSTYVAGTGVWTASGAITNVNTLLAGLTFTPATNSSSNFTIATSVSDGIAAAITGSKAVTGTAVNDTPSASNLSAAEVYTEDSSLNLVNIVTSDVDSATVTATLTLSNPSAGSLNTDTSGAVTSTYVAGTGVWTASGAIADVNILLAGLTFTPALNFNSNFTIATSISDGFTAATGSKAITGTAVNDAPSASNLSAGEVYTEDSSLNLVNIVASDVDSANVTATLTLSSPSAGSLNTGTSGAVTSTYVAGTGVWTASGAIANVNTLLAGLTFTPALNFNNSFTIATSISDGVATALTGTKAITGTAVNDAPTATNLSAAESYTENTSLNLVDIVVSDVDSANVTATLTLSNPGAGSLNPGTSGAVTSTYVAGTGIWTASGAIANVNTLLAGLTFTPATNFQSNFTIATSVSDGIAAALTGNKTMTGTSVNAAPVLTNAAAINGAFRFTVQGVTGTNYAVEATTNFSQWTSLRTNAGPTFDFTNPSPNLPSRFFRARLSP